MGGESVKSGPAGSMLRTYKEDRAAARRGYAKASARGEERRGGERERKDT